MAAIRAAERGRRTLLLEKNRKAGVKILMSGGTRCNITHATDNRGIVAEPGCSPEPVWLAAGGSCDGCCRMRRGQEGRRLSACTHVLTRLDARRRAVAAE